MIGPDEVTPPLRWVWSLPNRAACLGAGLAAERYARQQGWPHAQASELLLVVVELTTNALRHGKRGMCALTFEGDEARLIVYDEGSGFPDWVVKCHASAKGIEDGRPAAVRPHGLGAGLDVVRRLTTELKLVNDPHGGGARAVARVVRRGSGASTRTLP